MYSNRNSSKKMFDDIYTIYKNRKTSKSKSSKLSNRSFLGSIKWLLIIGQCFAQIPVTGITNANARLIKFKWKSWRTFYCLLNCTGASFLTFSFLINVLKSGMDLSSFTSMVFHINTLIVTILFLKLAREWPRLMCKWEDMEHAMNRYGWPRYLHIRINLIVTIVLLIALIEYTMGKTHSILMSMKYRKNQALFKYYVTMTLYPELFKFTNYADWSGVLLQIMNVLLTFAWTYNDLFIMVLSVGLAARFQQITIRLQTLRSTKNTHVETWREIREDFNRLSQLTKTVDDALSYLIITSFTNNLYFILVQLFNSLRPIPNSLERVYFFFSFGFMIARTVVVSIYGAWIYDESKEPTVILNSICSDVYNIEIKRFLNQIKYDTVALSGKQFFYITRGLILSMAGAIVTYELVLIQFNIGLLQEMTSDNTYKLIEFKF